MRLIVIFALFVLVSMHIPPVVAEPASHAPSHSTTIIETAVTTSVVVPVSVVRVHAFTLCEGQIDAAQELAISVWLSQTPCATLPLSVVKPDVHRETVVVVHTADSPSVRFASSYPHNELARVRVSLPGQEKAGHALQVSEVYAAPRKDAGSVRISAKNIEGVTVQRGAFSIAPLYALRC